MIKRAVATVAAVACACGAYADGKIQGFRLVDDGVVVEVSALDGRTVHVRKYPEGQPQKASMVVDDADFRFGGYKVSERGDRTVLTTGDLTVTYDAATDRVEFGERKSGEILLKEKGGEFAPVAVLGDSAYSVSQTFELKPGEAVYGLGQFQEGVMNYRGHRVNLVHANREIANPVLLSTEGYLLFWDNYSKTEFSDSEAGARFFSEMGDGINYYFVYGPDMNGAVAGFRNLSGESPMLPKSAFGFWMSKERYRSFDELKDVVSEFRRRGIPLDNIVQDWQYWGEDMARWNGMTFDGGGFPDPASNIDTLHAMDVKLTLSVWPGVGPATAVYKDMERAGVLFDVPTWAGYKVVDIYDPRARAIYWDHLRRGLYDKGVDSWWMDATEPSFRDGLYQSKQEEWSKRAGMTAIGPFHRYLNTYSLVLSQMMYDSLRSVSDRRVSILTRSAFAGQQRYGTSTWSGDIYASWSVLRKQIPAGLNLCMTGIPYWTTDIGGFRVRSSNRAGDTGAGEIGGYSEKQTSLDGGYRGGLKDSAYLELYTRWFQYAVFNPMFRAHGTEVPREIWQFGEPGTPYYDIQVDMIRLRYTLLSYIYSSAWDVTSRGGTMMRALAMDFTADPEVYDIADAYMFGGSMMACPVTRPMYHDRSGRIAEPDESVDIYLPRHEGGCWYDLAGGRRYDAGRTISYRAPLDVIPVFVRGGAIVPRNDVAQHVAAADDSRMEIVVYPGADASFTLYEDDNETYAYERGEYSTIRFDWDDSRRRLTIGPREGEFDGMIGRRSFTVKVAENDRYRTVATVNYDGRREKIEF